jgi:nitrate/nitrite transport system substrate-binding protein
MATHSNIFTTEAGGALEKPRLRLGFIPLTDCAVLAVAQEYGYFDKYGLNVALSREASWANIRDKVSFGALDGAQMLAGMPLASSLGAEAFQRPMVTGFAMSLNGNAITVSNDLYQKLLETDAAAMADRPLTAETLKRLILAERERYKKPAPLHFATVYPCSSHNYLLRYWLASAGIDPDRDVSLTVVPPPAMVEYLRRGLIDGYCVGEPWNSRAVEEGLGRVLISSYEIWNNHPEKVFGVTRQWAEAHPNTHRAILMALIEAAHWLDQPENRAAAAELLARPDYVNLPAASLRDSLLGRFRYGAGEAAVPLPDFHVFHRYSANIPRLAHAEWLVSQMLRWGQLKGSLDVSAAAAGVYLPELYREAAGGLGLPCPPSNQLVQGVHDQPWLLATATHSFDMGPDRFFDGAIFQPASFSA